MTSDVAVPLLLSPHGGPETLFRLGPMALVDGVASATMAAGPWLADAGGRPMAGALAVLLDDVLGQALLARRPAGHLPVTTELAFDLAAPLPLAGPGLRADAEPVLVDASGGLARGMVRDAHGRTIATGTLWSAFVTEVPYGVRTDATEPGTLPPPAAVLRPGPGGPVLPDLPVIANSRGAVHGGVLAFASERAARGVAPAALETASVRISFLRPARAPVTVTPRVVHAGRTLAVVGVTATGADGRCCATATVGFRAAPRD